MRTALRLLGYGFAFAVIVFVVLFNARLYTRSGSAISTETPVDSGVRAQLKFLRGAIEGGADADMQRLFPEGRFFANCLYGLANVEAGMREREDSEERMRYHREAQWALARIDSAENKAVFPQELHPRHGVFYAGWSAVLHAGAIALQSQQSRDARGLESLRARCDEIAAAFASSPTPYLQAYQGQSWSCDSAVAIFALYACDHILEPRYGACIERWVAAVRERRDPGTGLLGHRVTAENGVLLDGPRATSMCITIRFLGEAAPTLGAELYESYREQMMTTRAGMPGVREYPKGVNGSGDIDSGPLILGISASASAVTIGVARVMGDSGAVSKMNPAAEALGMPITWNGGKRYIGGTLPVADAFLAWSRTARPWFSRPIARNWTPIFPSWWRIPAHALSLAAVVLLGLVVFRRIKMFPPQACSGN